MNLVVIGTGYVGLVSGACFAEMGNTVICIDIDEDKIANLKDGIIPIFEPGLKSIVDRNLKNGNLKFDTILNEYINSCDFVFIAVGTPMGEDGSADLKYVLKAARDIGNILTNSTIIINKSTVPVGTAEKVRKVIRQEIHNRNIETTFDVISNPEFLKEGDAVNDFMKPDRVIVGCDNLISEEKIRRLYEPFFKRSASRLIIMDIKSAEMTKYVANAMLATKISFMNEIANICELVGADVNKVRIGIGSDSRIGYSFIYPGSGYGGSCFPKDIRALKTTALKNNYNPILIDAVEQVNNFQKFIITKKIIKRFGNNLKGKVFALWGLSFKPGTDDMREAPSIYVIKELLNQGAKIRAYDPKAIPQSQDFYLKGFEGISYYKSKYEAIKGANAMVLLTEWKEFRSPNFEKMKDLLKESIIFDGRNQYDFKKNEGIGLRIFSNWKNIIVKQLNPYNNLRFF